MRFHVFCCVLCGSVGFKYALDSCSSLILACALHGGHIDSALASNLARLEVRHQVRYGVRFCGLNASSIVLCLPVSLVSVALLLLSMNFVYLCV